MYLRTLLRNGAPLSPLSPRACALFLSPRGCTPKHPSRPRCRRPNLPTLLFTSACRLFALSFHFFQRSFPLFSMACSLFSQNTGGMGIPVRLVDSRRESTKTPDAGDGSAGHPGGGIPTLRKDMLRETFPRRRSYLNASTCREHTASLASSNARSGKEKFRHESCSPPTH